MTADTFIEIRPAGRADAGALYAVAAAAPEQWPRLAGGVLPRPEDFIERAFGGRAALFAVEADGRIFGCVELYDENVASLTVWIGVTVAFVDDAASHRELAYQSMVDRVFSEASARKVYARHAGFEAPPFSSCGFSWHEESRTPDAVRHEGMYWDDVITAVYRRDWEGRRDR